jgi:SNF2 family DNA or RNA helicase
MSSLVLIDGKFVISGTTQEHIESIKAIPGATWSNRLKAWTWLPEYKTYRLLKVSFVDINISDGVQAWVDKYLAAVRRMKNIKNQQEVSLTSDIASKLYGYQRVGVNFMIKGGRVINADDMGLGKTLESIAASEESNSQRILIVTLNSLKFNWEAELNKWGSKPITIINGDKAKRDKRIADYQTGYMVINYEGMRLHPELAGMQWDVMICDEAHKLKNKDTLHTMACKRIDATYRWALTGTPMENAPHELWSLLNWLFPKSFSSYWRFVDQYCVVNEFAGKDDKTIRVPCGAISSKEMHELLQPVMIRRLKTDVLPDLPEKQYVCIPVEMTKEDRRVYKDILKEMIAVLDNGDIVATPTVLTQFTRLKQVCISQHLLGTKRDGVTSAKLQALEDLVESSIADHKIVIYTTLAEGLKITRNNLNARGWKTVEVHGGVTPEGRQLAIHQFQTDPDCRIFLATIQAGGTGIDGLQYVSDMQIFLDKHPNPMKNLQAEDRLMRIGQKNALTIYSIINKDSIEEYIEYKLLRKETSFNSIIDGQLTFLDKYYEHLSKRWN